MGLKDVIASLTFLNKVITNFGGASGQVVMAGQSSGATLIRALLAAPSTSSLFKSAILQSDPMVSILEHLVVQCTDMIRRTMASTNQPLRLR